MKYTYAFSLILASCLQSTVTASSADSPISTPEVLPSGGASVDYASKYESVKSSILEKAMGEVR